MTCLCSKACRLSSLVEEPQVYSKLSAGASTSDSEEEGGEGTEDSEVEGDEDSLASQHAEEPEDVAEEPAVQGRKAKRKLAAMEGSLSSLKKQVASTKRATKPKLDVSEQGKHFSSLTRFPLQIAISWHANQQAEQTSKNTFDWTKSE